MLSANELRELFAAEMNAENALTVRVLLATAVRSGELRMAKWLDFDFAYDVWSIPTTKTGPGIQIPLTALVKAWLLEFKALAGQSAFVLPVRVDYRNANGHGDRPINPNTIGAAIAFWLTEQKPKVRRFTPHDLRSTAKRKRATAMINILRQRGGFRRLAMVRPNWREMVRRGNRGFRTLSLSLSS